MGLHHAVLPHVFIGSHGMHYAIAPRYSLAPIPDESWSYTA